MVLTLSLYMLKNCTFGSFYETFFLLRLRFTSTLLPSDLTWNTVFMPGLVILIAAWICCISNKNGDAVLLVLH